MKKCPYCAEEIQDEAIKCKHCSEFLNGTHRVEPPPLPRHKQVTLPFFFRTSTMIVLLLTLPPLALPAIIWHPVMSKRLKILSSLGILLLIWGLWILTATTMRTLKELLGVLHSI